MQSLGSSLPYLCFRIICGYGPMQAAAPKSLRKVMGRAVQALDAELAGAQAGTGLGLIRSAQPSQRLP